MTTSYRVVEEMVVSELRRHPHVPAERAELFQCYDGESMEIEFLELLYAIVRTTKPERVLVTGAAGGHETVVIARALCHNRVGQVICVDADAKRASRLIRYLEELGLHNAKVETAEPSAFLLASDARFEVALFDSVLEHRPDELRICLERDLLPAGAVVVVHDTSRLRVLPSGDPDPATASFWGAVAKLEVCARLRGPVEWPLSRGLLLWQVSDAARATERDQSLRSSPAVVREGDRT